MRSPLVGGILPVLYGTRAGFRGPVYIGAISLVLFVFSVGLHLTLRCPMPGDTIVVRPLLLAVAGVALLLLSFVLPGGPRRPPAESLRRRPARPRRRAERPRLLGAPGSAPMS